MGRKTGHRLSAESKKRISEGMKRHHAKRDGKQQNYCKVFPEDRATIMELYNDGKIPVREIAAMYNISEKHLFTIINLLQEEGENDQ